MIQATFYCNIVGADEEILDEDFDFDEGTFKTEEELDRYIRRCGYEIGEPCARWGDDVGILTRIEYSHRDD